MTGNPEPELIKPLLKVARDKAVQSPQPIWMMRQAGRHLPEFQALKAMKSGFLDLCYSPDAAAEATLQPIRRYGLDAAIIFSDILVVPHGLGQTVEFSPGPKLEPIHSSADLNAFSAQRMVDFLQPVYEAIRRTAAALKTESPTTALYGFCGAPFTVASYMIEGHSSKDHASVRRWANADAEGFARLIALLIDASVAHLVAQIDAGAEIVQIFDSWAGDLTADEQSQWSLKPCESVANRVRAERPATPIAVFPRGVGPTVSKFAATGAFDVIGLSTDYDLNLACELPDQIATQGNLDPQVLVRGGGDLDLAIDHILFKMQHRPHIFNLGHGVPPETPIPHVEHLISRIREGRV